MKPVQQTQFHDDRGGIGNCFEACVASLFELEGIEDVPNFGKDRWFPKFLRWIEERGYTSYGALHYESVQNYKGGVDGYYIVVGGSPRFPNLKGGHAVVYREGAMVHDPYPIPSGILTPWYILSIEKKWD